MWEESHVLIKLFLVREDSERTWWWPLNGQSAVLWKRGYLCESALRKCFKGRSLYDKHCVVKYIHIYTYMQTSLAAQTVKHLPTMQETWVQSLSREDPLDKEMATHSSTVAWKIPWMEDPGRLQSMGLQRVGHDWATLLCLSLTHWKRPDAGKDWRQKKGTAEDEMVG